LLVLAIACVVGTTTMQGSGFETDISYYSDDTFQTYVGEFDEFCDLTQYSTGSTGSWRVYDRYSCSTGRQAAHLCQQTDGMGGWINVGCPPGV
jgi:hypothetical protein